MWCEQFFDIFQKLDNSFRLCAVVIHLDVPCMKNGFVIGKEINGSALHRMPTDAPAAPDTLSISSIVGRRFCGHKLAATTELVARSPMLRSGEQAQINKN